MSCSQRQAQGGDVHIPVGHVRRNDLLLYLPGRPVVVHMWCVTHPLAPSADVAAAWGAGGPAQAKSASERDKYDRTGTGACRFVPLSHEMYGRAAPPASAILLELAEHAASTGAVFQKHLHGERDTRRFHNGMTRHYTAGPRLDAVVSVYGWQTGPPWAACSD